MARQCGMQAFAGGDIGAHCLQQRCHVIGLPVAGGDIERLQQRQAGMQHGGQLAQEGCDLLVADPGAGTRGCAALGGGAPVRR